MSKESRQRLREAAKRQEARFARSRNLLGLFPFIAAALIATGTFIWIHSHEQKPDTISKTESMSFKRLKTLNELLALSPAGLEHCDIARLNLLCADPNWQRNGRSSLRLKMRN